MMRRETAVQQLAEHEKGIEGARSQIGPLRESIEQQLQAMKVSQSPVSSAVRLCHDECTLVQRPHRQTC